MGGLSRSSRPDMAPPRGSVGGDDSGRVVGRGNRPDLPEEGFGRRGRGRSVGGRSSLTTTNLRSLTTTNLRTRNEEESTAGGSFDFVGVGHSPTIVGGDDLTRRAAHARMDLVDGALVLRGGGYPSTRVRTRRRDGRTDGREMKD